MEKIADLALVPPKLNTSPLPEYDYDKLDYGMTISIERTPGGRSVGLLGCGRRQSQGVLRAWPRATTTVRHRGPDPRLVVDSHNPRTCRADRSVLVGNLWTDPLGRLWLIFDQSMEMFDGRGWRLGLTCARIRTRIRTVPGRRPRRIWHGVTLNKPTVSIESCFSISVDAAVPIGMAVSRRTGDAMLGVELVNRCQTSAYPCACDKKLGSCDWANWTPRVTRPTGRRAIRRIGQLAGAPA